MINENPYDPHGEEIRTHNRTPEKKGALLKRRVPTSLATQTFDGTIIERASSFCFFTGRLRERQSHSKTITQGEAMISVLAQERLLGAVLGSVFTGIVVFEQRKSIYRLISENQHQSVTQSQMTEPVFGKKSSSNVAHIWNKAVDQTLGPVIASLSSRRW